MRGLYSEGKFRIAAVLHHPFDSRFTVCPQYFFPVQILIAQHSVYCYGNFVSDASARFSLLDHIDLSGWPMFPLF